MSLIEVSCINCRARFKITKGTANAGGGFADCITVPGNGVELTACWCVMPPDDDHCLCPRCACAAIRVSVNAIEAQLPALMKGELSTSN